MVDHSRKLIMPRACCVRIRFSSSENNIYISVIDGNIDAIKIYDVKMVIVAGTYTW